MSYHVAVIELVSTTIKRRERGQGGEGQEGQRRGCEEDKTINSERHVEVERRGEERHTSIVWYNYMRRQSGCLQSSSQFLHRIPIFDH